MYALANDDHPPNWRDALQIRELARGAMGEDAFRWFGEERARREQPIPAAAVLRRIADMPSGRAATERLKAEAKKKLREAE